jgi:Chaperone for flagella basal body P-ring formation
MNMPLATKFATIAPLLIAASLAAQTPIHRYALNRAEIAAAIQKSLDANNLSAGSPLSPNDIITTSRIDVTESHPVLAVTQIESRPGANTTHVALWTTSEPRTPPFWVTVDRKIEAPADSNKSAAASTPDNEQNRDVRYISRAPIALHSIARAAAANEPPLVHVGNPLQLIVQGAGMRIMAKAKALDTGRANQQIRVQIEPGGKILVAKIVTAQTAEIDY